MNSRNKILPILLVSFFLINSISLFLTFRDEIEMNFNPNEIISPISSYSTSSNFTEKNFYAIVVGIENYTGDLFDLDYCRDDAYDMVSFLTTECNVPNENIIILVDHNATVENIDTAFDQINSTIMPEDDFFVYFSGHGGDGFFQTYYGVPANNSAYYNYTHLDTILDGINCSKKYVVIDACYSGSVIPIISDSNRGIMTSCASSELCWEDSALQNGIFTYYFINALNNSSDINSDDVISFEEMYNSYIYGNARNYAKQYHGSYQNEQLYDGINGESILYPSIGAVTYELNNVDYLDYQFIIFGTGLICNISLIIYFNDTEIFLNLTDTNSTNNAFSSYIGSIKLNSSEKPNNCTISVFIEGSINKTIIHNYIFVDPIPNVPADEPPVIPFGSYFISYLLVTVFVVIFFTKRRLKYSNK